MQIDITLSTILQFYRA